MSKIYRSGPEAEVAAHRWKEAEQPPPDGVQDFEPRPVGDSAEPEPPPVEEPPETEPAAPPVDVEQIREQALAEGRLEGEKAGIERTAAEYTKKLDELGAVLGELEGYKSNLRTDAEREVVDLAFEVAKRILRREVNVDPTTALAMVKTCMDEFAQAEVTRILVHPDDREVVAKYVGEGVEVTGDAEIERGGAVLETKQGRLDARIDSQLREIELGLADR